MTEIQVQISNLIEHCISNRLYGYSIKKHKIIIVSDNLVEYLVMIEPKVIGKSAVNIKAKIDKDLTVIAPKTITTRFLDLNTEIQELKTDGFLSAIICHQIKLLK